MPNKDDVIIASLKAHQRKHESTQVELAAALGVHQAHLSKVLACKVPLSRKLKAKIEGLLQGDKPSNASLEELEVELIHALRSSSAFRALIRAAMQLHRRQSSESAE